MTPQSHPQTVYELIPAPKTDIVQDLLRRALKESQEAFNRGAALRASGAEELGAGHYIRAIAKLESAALMCLEILERRPS